MRRVLRSVVVAAVAALAGAVVGASPATAVPNPGGIGSPGATAPEVSGVFDQEVFETGLDHTVIRWRYGDSATQRSSIGGYALGGPAATLANGPIVVVRGRDSAIWINHRPDGQPWSGWTSLGGQTTHRPALGHRGADLVLAVRGTDGRLWERTRPADGGAWAPWSLDGQPLVGGPGNDAILDAEGQIRIRNSAGWPQLPWLPSGLHAVGEPYRTSNGLWDTVLVRGSDGQCWRWSSDEGWSSLGGQFISGFSEVSTFDGVGQGNWIFGRGTNGRLYVQGFGHSTWTQLQ